MAIMKELLEKYISYTSFFWVKVWLIGISFSIVFSPSRKTPSRGAVQKEWAQVLGEALRTTLGVKGAPLFS